MYNTRVHIFDKFTCLLLYERSLLNATATVVRCDQRPTTRARPVPLNLIELQVMMLMLMLLFYYYFYNSFSSIFLLMFFNSICCYVYRTTTIITILIITMLITIIILMMMMMIKETRFSMV